MYRHWLLDGLHREHHYEVYSSLKGYLFEISMFLSGYECFIENSKAGYYVIIIRPNANYRNKTADICKMQYIDKYLN